MKRILLLVALAGRRLAADGVPFIDSRHARRLLVLSATLTAAMLVGLLGYATSSRADVACNEISCLEKTASADPVTVGQPLTFTITGSCPPGTDPCGVSSRDGVTDTLPAGLEFVRASATGGATCSESAGTVTCAPFSFGTAGSDVVTIEVIPTECGTFTNTATFVFPGFSNSVSETFTVNCVQPDTEAPKVTSTFPRNGGEVGPAANVRATFSEEMDSASVISAFKLFKKGSTNQIAAQVTYDAATDTATLNPTNNLRKGATYKAVVTTQAKDTAGNRLDQNSSKAGLQQKVWFFERDN
jgi:uncharacterized repeat protein (TIGR01451 family)